MRSSVEGNAVRAYVSFKTLSWLASARFLFFLTVGSSVDVGEIGGGVQPCCGGMWQDAELQLCEEGMLQDSELLKGEVDRGMSNMAGWEFKGTAS